MANSDAATSEGGQSLLRNDPLQAPPDDIKRYLDEHYFESLPHRDVYHPKLLVVFSGGNAVGKSSLATRIRDDLQALVLENDAIKTELMAMDGRYGPGDFKALGQATWNYTMDLYQRLDSITTNGLIVRDAVIDWYYQRIMPIFLDKGYELFVIRLDVSREKMQQQVDKRGGKAWISTERLHTLMDEHDKRSAIFLQDYPADIILDDDSLFDYDRVINALRAKLESLEKS